MMPRPCYAIARAALARGPLVMQRQGNHRTWITWRCGRRLFSAATINVLIASGEAVRVGEVVVANV